MTAIWHIFQNPNPGRKSGNDHARAETFFLLKFVIHFALLVLPILETVPYFNVARIQFTSSLRSAFFSNISTTLHGKHGKNSSTVRECKLQTCFFTHDLRLK